MFNSTISGKRGDAARGLIVKAVAGVALELQRRRRLRRRDDALEFVLGALRFAALLGVAPGAGVQLDDGRAEVRGGLKLPRATPR